MSDSNYATRTKSKILFHARYTLGFLWHSEKIIQDDGIGENVNPESTKNFENFQLKISKVLKISNLVRQTFENFPYQATD